MSEDMRKVKKRGERREKRRRVERRGERRGERREERGEERDDNLLHFNNTCDVKLAILCSRGINVKLLQNRGH